MRAPLDAPAEGIYLFSASLMQGWHACLPSGCRRALERKQAARQGVIDKLAHGHWFSRYQVLGHARGNAANAVGFAPVVTESELIEIDLQVLGADRAMMRAQKRALQI